MLIVGVIGAAACASMQSPAIARPSTVTGTIRSLSIVPAGRTACPGEIISTRYEAIVGEQSRVTLGAGDMGLLNRSGAGITPLADGRWQTDANPLVSAATGFRLRARAVTDSTVRADTVVIPSYACDKFSIDARGIASAGVFLRLGVLRSAFYDSVVVAALEYSGGVGRVLVLGPRDLRKGAIRVDATGAAGAGGASGHDGADGAACERGSRGENGDDGSSGGSGGRVDIIVQADAPWLADLVVVSNAGGPGGPGGRGGRGGRNGTSSGRGGTTCTSGGAAPNGMAGRQGSPGIAGPMPVISTIPFPLVWTGSPLWASETMRGALEQLIALTQKR